MWGLLIWCWITCLQGVHAFPYEITVEVDDLLLITALGIVIIVLASKAKKSREPICQIKFLKDVHKDVEDFVGSLLKNDVTPKGNSSFVIKGCFGGKELATRIIKKEHYKRRDREVDILKLTKDNVHVMPLLFNIEISGYFCLLMPQYTSLEKFLDDNEFKKEESVLNNIIYQIAKGISALHDIDIVHGNLRPACIFLDFFGEKCRRAILSNFSCSQVGQNLSSVCGASQQWSAPEVLSPKPKVSAKSDAYSLGLIAYVVWISIVDKNNKAHKMRPIDTKYLSDQLKPGNKRAGRLLQKLIKQEPEKRMSVKEVMKDPVFWKKGRLPFFFECLKYCSERKNIVLDNTKKWINKVGRRILGGAYEEGQPQFVRFIRNKKVHPMDNHPNFGDRYKIEEWMIRASFEDDALDIVDAALPQVDNEFIDEFFGPQADL